MLEEEIEDYPALATGGTQCPLCATTCKQSNNLRSHMLTAHKKRVPAGKKGRPSTGGKVVSNKRYRDYVKSKANIGDNQVDQKCQEC